MFPKSLSFGSFRTSAATAAAILVLCSVPAGAADKVTFLTSWFAQAEHGGFYQAKASGPLREGRPRRHHQDGRSAGQRHATAAGRRDRRHDGLRPPGAQDAGAGPAASSRSRPRSSSICRESWRTTTWRASPTSRTRPSWSPPPAAHVVAVAQAQIRIHRRADQALHLQPAAVLRRQERGAAVLSVVRAVSGQAYRACRSSSFCSRDDGYPPYGTTMVATRSFVERSPDVAARFVKASLEGWKSYLGRSRRRQRADQGRQSEDERRADRLRHRAAQGAQGARRRRRADDGHRNHHPSALEGDLRLHGSAGLLKPEVDWKQGFTDRIRQRPQTLDVAARVAPNTALSVDADERVGAGAPVIEIFSADKVFPNGTRALAAIDLTIAGGEFLTLIGPSGCGKSTLLKLIANLIEPTDGRICGGGRVRKGRRARQTIAFVFQDPTLMPWARVETNVRLPLDWPACRRPRRAARGRRARARRARGFARTTRGSSPAA